MRDSSQRICMFDSRRTFSSGRALADMKRFPSRMIIFFVAGFLIFSYCHWYCFNIFKTTFFPLQIRQHINFANLPRRIADTGGKWFCIVHVNLSASNVKALVKKFCSDFRGVTISLQRYLIPNVT